MGKCFYFCAITLSAVEYFWVAPLEGGKCGFSWDSISWATAALNCWSSVGLHSGATYWSEAPTVFFRFPPPPSKGVSFPRHISQPWETPPVSVVKYKAVSQASAAAAATAPCTRFSVDAAAMETTRPASSFPHLLWRWNHAKRATTAYRSTTCYYNWLVTAGRRWTLISKGFFFYSYICHVLP